MIGAAVRHAIDAGAESLRRSINSARPERLTHRASVRKRVVEGVESIRGRLQ
jgi:hypothetical protein